MTRGSTDHRLSCHVFAFFISSWRDFTDLLCTAKEVLQRFWKPVDILIFLLFVLTVDDVFMTRQFQGIKTEEFGQNQKFPSLLVLWSLSITKDATTMAAKLADKNTAQAMQILSNNCRQISISHTIVLQLNAAMFVMTWSTGRVARTGSTSSSLQLILNPIFADHVRS